MLGIDFAVWLALMLSLASVALCVGYGASRWNLDDDSDPEPSPRDTTMVHGTPELGKAGEDE